MKVGSKKGTSAVVARAEQAILLLVQTIAPGARIEGMPYGGHWTCVIITETDAEKKTILEDIEFLAAMNDAAAKVGRMPDKISAESQETVDRRWGGDWSYVFR